MKILTKWIRSYVPAIAVDDHQLAQDLTLRGIAVEGVHDLGTSAAGQPNGHLFEMDITTNRVDAMNHYGVAREAATIYDLPLVPLDTVVHGAAGDRAFPVEIHPEAREVCGRFTARVLRGVTIAPSAGQIAEYFSLLGQKQISNAVDASNFVLQGMGHPTHAFDLDKIEGGIVVRLARAGEKLKLLDASELTLAPDDLVIADQRKALSLAGVMGGWDSMITPETKNILVESAWFDPATVRRSARRHGLHTDASHRFERGADFNAAPVANDLVASLILANGGQAEGGLIDVTVPEAAARTVNRPPIHLSVSNVQRLLGVTVADSANGSALTPQLIAQYLRSLGCRLTEVAGADEVFSVQLPSWRLDLEREIDLMEEIARVFGYNRFANTLPSPLPVKAHPVAAAEAAVRARLLALGYTEAISSTFASEADAAVFAPEVPAIALENPLSEEARLLRPSLLPGMTQMIANNLNRDVREARLFEAGATFTRHQQAVVERESLALGITGELAPTALNSPKDAGFFELKGTIESVLSLFALTAPLAFSGDTAAWIEPGRGATVLLGEKSIAQLGELSQTEREARKLRQPVWLATLDLAALYALPLRTPTARELSRFQAVERDFSFTLGDTTTWADVASAIEALHIGELTHLAPAEIFRDAKGAAVPKGHYALLVRCTFQSQDRTLRDDELAAWSTQIVSALTSLGGVQRA